jgi:phage gpG-like protein
VAEAIDGITRVLNRFVRMQARARNPRPALIASSVYMLGSIDRNFQSGGRPVKWVDLSASTLAARRRGKGKGGVKILVDEAQLKNSMWVDLQSDSIAIGPGVVYARRQNWGYPGGPGRGHSHTPARPFMLFQEEDVPAIAKIFSRFLMAQ